MVSSFKNSSFKETSLLAIPDTRPEQTAMSMGDPAAATAHQATGDIFGRQIQYLPTQQHGAGSEASGFTAELYRFGSSLLARAAEAMGVSSTAGSSMASDTDPQRLRRNATAELQWYIEKSADIKEAANRISAASSETRDQWKLIAELAARKAPLQHLAKKAKKDPNSLWLEPVAGMGVHNVKIANVSQEFGQGVRTVLRRYPRRDTQLAAEVNAIGALASFMPDANVVVAERRKDLVVTEHIAGLRTGDTALYWLKAQSKQTQHTALAALSFQLWDLHRNNIGIDANRHLVLFDTDLAYLESNQSVQAGSRGPTPPLGANHLQTLNLCIDDAVLEAHIQQLKHAILSEFPGSSHNFNQEESLLIKDLLLGFFAETPELRIHRDNNQVHSDRTLEDVKVRFLDAFTPVKAKFLQRLKEKGLAESKIRRISKQPQLLHPTHSSFAQIKALDTRYRRLLGFVHLRKTLNRSLFNLGSEDLRELSEVIIQEIHSLPVQAWRKKHILSKLLDHSLPANDRRAVLVTVKELFVGEIKWNTLAKSVYPTLAKLHDDLQLKPYGPKDIASRLGFRQSGEYRRSLEAEIKELENFEGRVSDRW